MQLRGAFEAMMMDDDLADHTNRTTHIEDHHTADSGNLIDQNHPVTIEGANNNATNFNLHDVVESGDRRLETLFPLPSTIDEMKANMDPDVIARIERYKPVFSYDSPDGGGITCFPAAAVSRWGHINKGISSCVPGNMQPCVRRDFLKYSNTYHRWGRFKWSGNGLIYEVHMFSLYFEVDVAPVCAGHRHDFENVLVIFRAGSPYKVAVSAHGEYIVKRWHEVPKHFGKNPKIVYHRGSWGFNTNGFRFAKKSTEHCSSILKLAGQCWNTPPIVSWEYMKGSGGLNNAMLKNVFNKHDFGKASAPFRSWVFKRDAGKIVVTNVSSF